MTKKELKWRLSELPSGGEVAELVAEGVITKDEARQILFNETTAPTQKVKELEEEVKFLRELCDKLAAKSNGWTTIVREYRDYRPHYPAWYGSYGGVINAGTLTTATGGINAVTTAGSTNLSGTSINVTSAKMLSNLN